MMSAERKSGSGDNGAGPALECRSVTVELPHRFGRKRIIEDISFQVRSGEFLTIVGPSGTGKTTVCTENLIPVDDVMESPKLAE